MLTHRTRVVLVSAALLAVSLTLAAPAVPAQFNPTSAADLIYDGSKWVQAYFDGHLLGSELVRLSGPVAEVWTPYDITVKDLKGLGQERALVIVAPSGNVVEGGSATAYDTGPSQWAVTFAAVKFNGAAIYTLRVGTATGPVVGAFYAGPQALTVNVTPDPVVSRPAATIGIMVTKESGSPAGLMVLNGPGIPENFTTSSSSTTITYETPAAGTQYVRAEGQTYRVATNGVDVPEEFGVGYYEVDGPVFAIGDHTGSAVIPVRVPIKLGGVEDFGAATVRVRFNASVVKLLDVTPGNIPGSNLTWAYNNSTGAVTILVTTEARPGASGDFEFAVLRLSAVGPSGSKTPLDITVVEAVDSDGDAIPAGERDGSFRAGLLGDADGDGDVDLDDVNAISDVVVGKRPLSSISVADADVSRDGAITGKDALYLRQHLAGVRPDL